MTDGFNIFPYLKYEGYYNYKFPDKLVDFFLDNDHLIFFDNDLKIDNYRTFKQYKNKNGNYYYFSIDSKGLYITNITEEELFYLKLIEGI